MNARDLLLLDDELEIIVNGGISVAGVDLFNSLEFHELHRRASDTSFHFVMRRRSSGAPVAVAGFLESTRAHFKSPMRGSFGGFALVRNAGATLEQMEKFAAGVSSFLVRAGAKQVTMVLPPLSYHPHETSAWINILLRAGYSISRHELSYALSVQGSFLTKIDYGNRKRLVKGQTAKLLSRRLAHAEYEAAYAVIEENRRRKGHTVSMTWAALNQMCEQLPESVVCFGVNSDEGQLVAAAFCIVVNPTVLYVFYWGDIAGVESLSPITTLAKFIYEYCLAEGYALLDLGTSTSEGIPNHGLIRYKKNLGAEESLKLTLHLSLS